MIDPAQVRAHQPPARMWTCRICPFGVDIVIACDDTLLSAVEGQLSPWFPETVNGSADSPARITAYQTDGIYALREGSQVLFTALGADRLMVGLQNWIDAEITRARTDLVPVHAGVVAWDDRAILVPGASGAGKTTLVSALVERGAAYYSDELAFLDPRGRVHAYPRHMVVRDALGATCTTPTLSGPPPAQALPVGLILGLRFDARATWRVHRIPASDAVLLLLANTAHRLSDTGIPGGLLEAAGSARSYRGERGEAGEASARVLQLAGSLPR